MPVRRKGSHCAQVRSLTSSPSDKICKLYCTLKDSPITTTADVDTDTDQSCHKDPSCCPVESRAPSTPPPPCLTRGTMNPFPISVISAFQQCSIDGIVEYVTFQDWFASGSITASRPAQVVCAPAACPS